MSLARSTKVAIIGAGIGGLAAAIALRRVGIEVGSTSRRRSFAASAPPLP